MTKTNKVRMVSFSTPKSATNQKTNEKTEAKSRSEKASSLVLECRDVILEIIRNGGSHIEEVVVINKEEFDPVKAKYGDAVYEAIKIVGEDHITEGKFIFGKVYGLIRKK